MFCLLTTTKTLFLHLQHLFCSLVCRRLQRWRFYICFLFFVVLSRIVLGSCLCTMCLVWNSSGLSLLSGHVTHLKLVFSLPTLYLPLRPFSNASCSQHSDQLRKRTVVDRVWSLVVNPFYPPSNLPFSHTITVRLNIAHAVETILCHADALMPHLNESSCLLAVYG